MADHRRWTRPRSPWLTGKVDMWKEWAGMVSLSLIAARTLQVMPLNRVVMLLSYVARQVIKILCENVGRMQGDA